MLSVRYTCERCGHLVVAPIECVVGETKDTVKVLSFCLHCGHFNYPSVAKK